MEARERDAGAVADGRRLFEREARRLVCKCAAGADADVLGVRSGALEAEDLVADGELVDAVADLDDFSRELHPGRAVLGSEEAGEDAREERLRTSVPAVRPVDGRRMNLDENLVFLRSRPLDLLDPQNLRGPVAIEHNCLHLVPFRLSA